MLTMRQLKRDFILKGLSPRNRKIQDILNISGHLSQKIATIRHQNSVKKQKINALHSEKKRLQLQKNQAWDKLKSDQSQSHWLRDRPDEDRQYNHIQNLNKKLGEINKQIKKYGYRDPVKTWITLDVSNIAELNATQDMDPLIFALQAHLLGDNLASLIRVAKIET